MLRTLVLLTALGLASSVEAPGPTLAAGTERPMTNEDVVVLLVRGTSEDDVAARIRESVPAFDLSDGMIDELRVAGVPERILAVMRARQAEVERPAAPSPRPDVAKDAAERSSVLRVAVVTAEGDATDDGHSAPVVVRMPAALPDAVARRLELAAAPEARVVHGVALFVACVEPTHVPDHWRSRSPLGRDFRFAPRHRILAFEPGSSESPEGQPVNPDPRTAVDHRLPGSLDAPVDGNDHEVVVGLALQVGDRWIVYRTVDLGSIDVPPEGASRAVRILAPRSDRLEQELETIAAN